MTKNYRNGASTLLPTHTRTGREKEDEPCLDNENKRLSDFVISYTSQGRTSTRIDPRSGTRSGRVDTLEPVQRYGETRSHSRRYTTATEGVFQQCSWFPLCSPVLGRIRAQTTSHLPCTSHKSQHPHRPLTRQSGGECRCPGHHSGSVEYP